VAADVAEAMAFLHQHQPAIVHRDLKSSNVLLDAAGRAVVCGARPPPPGRGSARTGPRAAREGQPARYGAVPRVSAPPPLAAMHGSARRAQCAALQPTVHRPARAQTLASPR